MEEDRKIPLTSEEIRFIRLLRIQSEKNKTQITEDVEKRFEEKQEKAE